MEHPANYHRTTNVTLPVRSSKQTIYGELNFIVCCVVLRLRQCNITRFLRGRSSFSFYSFLYSWAHHFRSRLLDATKVNEADQERELSALSWKYAATQCNATESLSHTRSIFTHIYDFCCGYLSRWGYLPNGKWIWIVMLRYYCIFFSSVLISIFLS